MTGRWRRVEKMPIAHEGNMFAVERYLVCAFPITIIYGAATRDEAQAIAARLRNTDAQIVTIARVEDAWKRKQ